MWVNLEYRISGRTGIKVSTIGIGGEGFENKSYEDCEPLNGIRITEKLIYNGLNLSNA